MFCILSDHRNGNLFCPPITRLLILDMVKNYHQTQSLKRIMKERFCEKKTGNPCVHCMSNAFLVRKPQISGFEPALRWPPHSDSIMVAGF